MRSSTHAAWLWVPGTRTGLWGTQAGFWGTRVLGTRARFWGTWALGHTSWVLGHTGSGAHGLGSGAHRLGSGAHRPGSGSRAHRPCSGSKAHSPCLGLQGTQALGTWATEPHHGQGAAGTAQPGKGSRGTGSLGMSPDSDSLSSPAAPACSVPAWHCHLGSHGQPGEPGDMAWGHGCGLRGTGTWHRDRGTGTRTEGHTETGTQGQALPSCPLPFPAPCPFPGVLAGPTTDTLENTDPTWKYKELRQISYAEFIPICFPILFQSKYKIQCYRVSYACSTFLHELFCFNFGEKTPQYKCWLQSQRLPLYLEKISGISCLQSTDDAPFQKNHFKLSVICLLHA